MNGPAMVAACGAPGIEASLERVGGLPRTASAHGPLRQRVAGPLPAAAVAWEMIRGSGGAWLDDAPAGRHLVAWRPRLCFEVGQRELVLVGPAGQCEISADPFGWLDAATAALRPTVPTARWIGTLGYELAGLLERLPPWQPDDLGMPQAFLGLHDAWLEGDAEGWWLVAVPGWRREVEVRQLARTVQRRLAGVRPTATDTGPGVGSCGAVTVVPDDEGFRAAVERTVRRIYAGEIFQTNLCRRFVAPCPPERVRPLYEALRSVSPARYGAYLQTPRGTVLSVSPERFLRVRGRTVVSDPIKGTRPREGREAVDDRRARGLLASDKDRAELAMIVDLARNDLGRVCVAGSVQVERFPALMELPTVLHTWARVSGRLRPDATPGRVLAATFPPASITGAPKIQAMIVARTEEPYRRGVAMGAIGWIDNRGDMELSVAIRTAVQAGGRVVYHAGCGIVADSEPERECAESLDKARAFLRALGAGEAEGA